jgi:hypothetical protein
MHIPDQPMIAIARSFDYLSHEPRRSEFAATKKTGVTDAYVNGPDSVFVI